MFYAPHLLCKMWEGGKVSGIISGLNAIVLDRAERNNKARVLAQYLVDNLNTHNIWAIKIFITEIIYFLNVILNLYFIDVFLDGEFRKYGLEVVSMMEDNPEDRCDPMARIFPKVTKCTFNKFGPTGTLMRRDALCVLPVNIINEKIYVFLWFWLLILMAVTALALLYSGFLLVAPSVRQMLLRSRAAHQSGALSALDQVNRFMEVGDWKIFYILGINMEPLVFGELMEEFAKQMEDANHNSVTQEGQKKVTQI